MAQAGPTRESFRLRTYVTPSSLRSIYSSYPLPRESPNPSEAITSSPIQFPQTHHSQISMANTALISFILVAFMCSLKGGLCVTFTMVNNCGHTVWPGILSNAGTAQLGTTGFSLDRGETRSIDAPTSWSGRMWGRTLCSTDSTTGRFTCSTGDCGSGKVECSGGGAAPPATLAEFTLDGDSSKDFYDVSLVDGYNLPMLVVPEGGSGPNCSATGCLVDLNGVCPSDLKVVLSSTDGASESVACRSACEAFGSPEYCCSGAYGNPNTCRPSSYSQFFKNACPRAYSYAYDDATSTFTCTAGGGYTVTFCPSTTSQKSGQSTPAAAAGLPLVNESMVFLGGEELAQASAAVRGAAPRLVSVLVAAAVWQLLQLLF